MSWPPTCAVVRRWSWRALPRRGRRWSRPATSSTGGTRLSPSGCASSALTSPPKSTKSASPKGLRPMGEGTRRREERVVRGGRADGDPRALARVGADRDRPRVARLRERGCLVAQAQPDEVRLGRGDGPAIRPERLADAVAFLDYGLHPLKELVLGVEGGDRGGLGYCVHGEREHGLADGLGNRLMADKEADAEARQAVGLGEGTQHGHVGTVAVEADAVGDVGVADVLAVGLVQDDQAVGRDLVQESGQLALANDGAGGVVRIADEDEPRPRGDG